MGNMTQQIKIKRNEAPSAPSMENSTKHIVTPRKPWVPTEAPDYQSHLWGT